MRMRLAALAALIGLVAALAPADARGRHHGGLGGHHGLRSASEGAGRGTALAADQRHANDDYVKAAAEEEDRLLTNRLKSICHGC